MESGRQPTKGPSDVVTRSPRRKPEGGQSPLAVPTRRLGTGLGSGNSVVPSTNPPVQEVKRAHRLQCVSGWRGLRDAESDRSTNQAKERLKALRSLGAERLPDLRWRDPAQGCGKLSRRHARVLSPFCHDATVTLVVDEPRSVEELTKRRRAQRTPDANDTPVPKLDLMATPTADPPALDEFEYPRDPLAMKSTEEITECRRF